MGPPAKGRSTIPPGSIFLCDSGGQYIGDERAGTTDITRTVWVGSADGKAEPSALIRWAEEVVRTREAAGARSPAPGAAALQVQATGSAR